MRFRRKLPDANWLETGADLLINLSAGWFGAILIAPNFTSLEYPFDLIILTQDLAIGIVSLVIAVRLKRLAKRNKND